MTQNIEESENNEVPATVLRAVAALAQDMPECEFAHIGFDHMAGGSEIELEITTEKDAVGIKDVLEESLTRVHVPPFVSLREGLKIEAEGYLSGEDAEAIVND